MARGYKTGGRKPGSKNKRTADLEAATAETIEKIEAALGEAFAGDAHTLLVATYKDKSLPLETRIDAAKAAIRFEKPALSNVEAKNEHVHRYVARLPEKAKTTEQWQQQHPQPTIQ